MSLNRFERTLILGIDVISCHHAHVSAGVWESPSI